MLKGVLHIGHNPIALAAKTCKQSTQNKWPHIVALTHDVAICFVSIV